MLERCYLHSPAASGEIWVLTISVTVSSDPAVSIFSSINAASRLDSIPTVIDITRLGGARRDGRKKGGKVELPPVAITLPWPSLPAVDA